MGLGTEAGAVAGTTDQAGSPRLYFPAGLLGFPGPRHFDVLTVPDTGGLFHVMRSQGEGSLTFPLVDPASVFPDYAPKATSADMEALELATPEQAIWMVIARIGPQLAATTVNLKAPLLINPFARLARQVVLEADYPVRQPLAVPQG